MIATPQDHIPFVEHILGKLLSSALQRMPIMRWLVQQAHPALIVTFHRQDGCDLMELIPKPTRKRYW
jgi:hypothetical protein